MTDKLADRTVAALRREHDALERLVDGLTAEQLTGPSACSGWTVAQVLSHLGSGAEISRASFAVALEGADPPAEGFPQGVWSRWDAMVPDEQARRSLGADAELVAALEGVPAAERDQPVVLGFLPAPLPLGAAAAMRLHEMAQHSYDVRATVDPPGAVSADSAAVLLDHFAGDLAFLLGFLGHPDALAEPATVAVGDLDLGLDLELVVGTEVRLAPAEGRPTARFEGPPEALLRLLAGRLGPETTPPGVAVTGNVGLDDLRRVFPGF